jgi:tRNA 2-thiouridine synthesizing protein B
MLHIVNKSPAQTTALASCLRLAQDGQAVLLTEDAVYAATPSMAASSGLAAAAKRLQVFVLLPDVQARGIAGKLIAEARTVGYDGFVDLVAEHPNNQSWL